VRSAGWLDMTVSCPWASSESCIPLSAERPAGGCRRRSGCLSPGPAAPRSKEPSQDASQSARRRHPPFPERTKGLPALKLAETGTAGTSCSLYRVALRPSPFDHSAKAFPQRSTPRGVETLSTAPPEAPRKSRCTRSAFAGGGEPGRGTAWWGLSACAQQHLDPRKLLQAPGRSNEASTNRVENLLRSDQSSNLQLRDMIGISARESYKSQRVVSTLARRDGAWVSYPTSDTLGSSQGSAEAWAAPLPSPTHHGARQTAPQPSFLPPEHDIQHSRRWSEP
jgi:hypothetical protein